MPENDPIIWRCISYRHFSGGMNWWSSQVQFDDMVATERLSEYIKKLEDRKVDKITIKRLGPLSYVMNRGIELGFDKIRSGADRIAHEKKNHKLDDYLVNE
jgi:hypothetical protein